MARAEKVPGGRAGRAMAAGSSGAGSGPSDAPQKGHRQARAGPSAERKKEKDKAKRGVAGGKEKGTNPKVCHRMLIASPSAWS